MSLQDVISRYGSSDVKKIFSEETRIEKMLNVEAALARALAEFNEIPKEAADVISQKAKTEFVTPERIKEIEKKFKHDIVALINALAEQCGEYGEYVHFGATSNDIIDTAWALQLKDSIKVLGEKLIEISQILCEYALKYKDLVMVGRTHGQHAIPTTLGFKFAVYAAEVSRHIERLQEMLKRILVGKIRGAVGTMASFGPKALEIERRVLEELKLKPAEITTQVICRDRYAELISWIAITGSTFDKIAIEIRNLQRIEILELAEGFDINEQFGSSTMPHKQNPIDCEKISGLAKVLRGFVIPSLENIPLWHERDLTNSSSERFVIPLSIIILDEILSTMIKVLKGLRVYPENMKRNLELSRGAIMAEAVMMALARKGMGRQKAYKLIRELTIKSQVENRDFKSILQENNEVRNYLSADEINYITIPSNYLGKTRDIISNTIKIVQERIKYFRSCEYLE
ncbi:MAG: adenylosuccinate lyase [Candidatus Methanomethylicia archaeon]